MPGKIDGNALIQADDGSTITVTDAQIPGDLRGVRGDGVGFGPFRLTSWADSTTVIENLAFEEADPETWIPFLATVGVAGTAAHYNRETDDIESDSKRASLSRRGLLVTIGAATLFVGTGSTQDEQTYNVASFDLERNRRGVKVDVDVGVVEWLEGEDVEFFLSADDTTVGTFDAGESGPTINPGTEGLVELESDTALTFIQELLAKARTDDTVIFEFRPQDTSFADEVVGEEIELSSEPVVVETVNNADPSDILLRMNDTVLPHTDESGSKPAGEWYVRDQTSLMYETGPETPDTTLVEIQTNVGLLERTWAKYVG